MGWDVSRWKVVLETAYVRGMPVNVLDKRMHLINEAIGWDGTLTKPMTHSVGRSSDDSLLLFEKPGKEARAGTNENDMRPVIIVKGKPLEPPSFSFIWSDLTNIAMADFEAFRAVLILIYRSAYLLDHRKDKNGNWRYDPSPPVMECINELDKLVGSKTEFGSVDGLLRFIDLLGWNEDVKYHSSNGKASFTEGKYGGKDPRIGRTRTFLTCIRVPYDVSRFMNDHRKEIESGEKADFVQLYEIMQALINSRGLCVPRTKEDLMGYLQPYLYDMPLRARISGNVSTHAIQRTIS